MFNLKKYLEIWKIENFIFIHSFIHVYVYSFMFVYLFNNEKKNKYKYKKTITVLHPQFWKLKIFLLALVGLQTLGNKKNV